MTLNQPIAKIGVYSVLFVGTVKWIAGQMSDTEIPAIVFSQANTVNNGALVFCMIVTTVTMRIV